MPGQPNCRTCGNQTHALDKHYWCPRCGTIKDIFGSERSYAVPTLVDRCREFEKGFPPGNPPSVSYSAEWKRLGIGEAIGQQPESNNTPPGDPMPAPDLPALIAEVERLLTIWKNEDDDPGAIGAACDLAEDYGDRILAALKQAATVQTQRNELAKALEQIEQMGHYPADLAPDLIGDPERDSKLCDRLADVANDALARIIGNNS